MNRKTAFLLGAASGAFVLGGAARASEATVYTYDALGRLTGAATTGGPNAGLGVATTYDPAGNRSSYSVAGSGGSLSASSPSGPETTIDAPAAPAPGTCTGDAPAADGAAPATDVDTDAAEADAENAGTTAEGDCL